MAVNDLVLVSKVNGSGEPTKFKAALSLPEKVKFEKGLNLDMETPDTGDPASPVAGDIWYDETAAKFRVRIGGTSYDLVTSPVALTQLAAQANNTVLGNISGSSAAPVALTQAQITALISAFSTSSSGAVPASGGGTTNFLRADATFANPLTGVPTLAHGTYTPTLTNVANAATTTASVCQYLRVGNTVTVSGKLAMTFTAANTLTQVGISLPIASNFANDTECGGAGGSHLTNTVLAAYIIGETTNNRAEIRCFSTSTASRTFFFTFTYLIV